MTGTENPSAPKVPEEVGPKGARLLFFRLSPWGSLGPWKEEHPSLLY